MNPYYAYVDVQASHWIVIGLLALGGIVSRAIREYRDATHTDKLLRKLLRESKREKPPSP